MSIKKIYGISIVKYSSFRKGDTIDVLNFPYRGGLPNERKSNRTFNTLCQS